MSKLLINEAPLVILPSLAKAIGIEKALVLQQIQYWTNVQGIGKDIDGEVWIWNTYSQWVTQFPFWSEQKIARLMRSLKKDGLVKIEQFNKSDYDRTNYYTINYNQLETLVNYDSIKSDSINGAQVDSINRVQSDSIYKGTETTTKTTTESKGLPPEINVQAWNEFVEHRSSHKKSFSKLARTKAINILKKHNYEDQQKLIDYSILGNYTGLYPEQLTKGNNYATRNQEITDRNMQLLKQGIEERSSSDTFHEDGSIVRISMGGSHEH